jgi:threonine 3-dehydrogenase
MAEPMRAVLKTQPGPGATLEEIPRKEPADDEVLLRVRATSICGTDVHIYRWDDWAASRIRPDQLPQIMGHEVCGEIVEVGSHVRGLRVGELVSCETHIPDPRDLQTLLGQAHVGEHMTILGVDRDGTFAEYLTVPARSCWVNDPRIPPELAAIQEPLGNALYAVLAEDHDVAGRSMVIIGDGPTGLFATAVARACGVAQIFLVGLSDFSLEIGRALGADHVLNASTDALDRVAYVKDHTGGYGADIVLDMAGSPKGLEEGFHMLRKGGRFTAFGVMSERRITLDYNNDVVFKGCQIHGINGRRIFDTWYRVSNLLASGRLDVWPVITHLLPLEAFEEGIRMMTASPRRAAKVVLFPNPEDLEAARARLEARKVSGAEDTGRKG